MLSDNPVSKELKSHRARAAGATKSWWSDKQKIECVTTYFLLGGNVKLTADKLRIPYETVRTWKKTDWWKELEEDIRREERLTISTKLRNLMEAGLIEVEDRLKNGDWIYDQKAGELKRKPVTMRDAGKLAIDAANLRTKMDIQENHTVASEHIEEKLSKLAKAFSDLARGQLGSIEDLPYKELPNDKEDTQGLQSNQREGEEPEQTNIDQETS